MRCGYPGCGYEIVERDGQWFHRLPSPAFTSADFPLASSAYAGAMTEWGHELGIYTLRTATHRARPEGIAA